MEKRDKEIILELKKRVPDNVRKHLRRVIVFGSRAKSQGTEDSDLNVLVLVDKKTPDIEKTLDRIAYSVMWDYDFKPIVSLKVFSEAHFNEAVNRGFSFYRHVEHEGISL